MINVSDITATANAATDEKLSRELAILSPTFDLVHPILQSRLITGLHLRMSDANDLYPLVVAARLLYLVDRRPAHVHVKPLPCFHRLLSLTDRRRRTDRISRVPARIGVDGT